MIETKNAVRQTAMIPSPAETCLRVAALYRFFAVADPWMLRDSVRALCESVQIKGTMIIAREGINGTVAGHEAGIGELISMLRGIDGFDGGEIKTAPASENPFRRLKVKVKPEIVTMGLPDMNTAAGRGKYVDPQSWNALISAEDTIVIDTRNRYETAIGRFKGAVDPATVSFREFPHWVEANREKLAGRKIAMYCTGGIRCEKATTYLKSSGFEDVFHLQGGILKYLEDVPAEQSLWQGECFVFDERVSVVHGLDRGNSLLCRACRHPLSVEERQSELFREGISCPHCYLDRTDDDRKRYEQRQFQIELAAKRGEPHPIGRSQAGGMKREASRQK